MYGLSGASERYPCLWCQAKNAYNVIDDIFFNIPLDHVCIPGLHVTLGIYI